MLKFRNGFTLIELLVAIAIMATLSTIVVANFRAGNKSKAVLLATDTVMSGIRTAQDSSLNPKAIATIGCTQSKLPTEYILRFNTAISTSFEMLAHDRCGATETHVETFRLPPNTRIKAASGLALDGFGAITNNVSVGSGGVMDIVLQPPFGKVVASINGGGQRKGFGRARIIIESTDTQVSKTVSLDGVSGRVDVQ